MDYRIKLIIGLATVGLVTGCAGEYVYRAPPAPQDEVRPEQPDAVAVWIGGYWDWDHGDYHWVPGYWDEHPRGEWIAPRWDHDSRGYHFVKGHWDNRREGERYGHQGDRDQNRDRNRNRGDTDQGGY